MEANNLSYNSLSELMYNTTVRLTCQQKGESMIGTGFFFRFDGSDNIYIVTNNHVALENAEKITFDFKIKEDGIYTIKSFSITPSTDIWIRHKEYDIAMTPLIPIINHLPEANKFSICYISESQIPSPEIIRTFEYIEDITMIGYPSGLINPKTGFPAIRRGITATPLQQSFPCKIDGYDKMMEDLFFIDAASVGGSSGSPVCICNSGSYFYQKSLYVGERFWFVGIMAAQAGMSEQPDPENPSLIIQHPIHLGIAIHARHLLDLKSKAVID